MLQGKGGVGKSFVCAMLAQYQMSKGKTPLCIDTDPINGTFHGYEALGVVKLEVLHDQEIVPRKFDQLVDLIRRNDNGNDVIIDNGASTFVPLSHYLLLHDIAGLLQELEHELVVHTVVVGGQAQDDTLKGFLYLVRQLPEPVSFVVWLNQYWGPVLHGEERFEDFEIYKTNRDRISAVVTIPELHKDTFGEDLSEMLRDRLTFNQALEKEAFSFMAIRRLKMIRQTLFELMDNTSVL